MIKLSLNFLDKKWRNLAIFGGALVLVFVLYLVLMPLPTTGQELKKKYKINAAGLTLNKNVTFGNIHSEKIESTSNISGYSIITIIPKSFAQKNSNVSTKTNNPLQEIMPPKPVYKISSENKKINFEMKASSNSLSCTINLIFRKKFLDNLSFEQKITLYSRFNKLAELDLGCDKANQIENSLSNEFEKIFKSTDSQRDTAYEFAKEKWKQVGINIETKGIISSFDTTKLLKTNLDSLFSEFLEYKTILNSKQPKSKQATDFIKMNLSIIEYLQTTKNKTIKSGEKLVFLQNLNKKKDVCENIKEYETEIEKLKNLKNDSEYLAQKMFNFMSNYSNIPNKMKLEKDIDLLTSFVISFKKGETNFEKWKKTCEVIAWKKHL